MSIVRTYSWQAPDMGENAGPDADPKEWPCRLGFIGVGAMGRHTLSEIIKRPGVNVLAVCDVDEAHMDDVCELIAESGQAHVPQRFRDFRDLNRLPDLDAVVISTPDHWHTLPAIDAMRSGKDCYIEKPLTLYVEEGQRLCEVARETGRITQTGSQQRSSREFRYACELIRNGYIGDITRVDLTIPANNRVCKAQNGDVVPDSLDFDFWLGPAPEEAFHPSRGHYDFRFIRAYSGGQMTNWGAHMLDIVQWALDEDASGPRFVEGTCTFSEDGIFNTADNVDVTWTYASGTEIHCKTEPQPRCEFIGTRGRLLVGRGHLETTPESLMDVTFTDSDERLTVSDDHMANFLEGVLSRTTTICPVDVGHRTANICHIGNIALLLGRRLEWDAAQERFVDDDEANTMLSRPVRAPWSLD